MYSKMAEDAAAGGWSTIESDEGVFTSLVETLGVKDVQFEEIFTLDAEAIRALSPVYGVIFLFKWLAPNTKDRSKPVDGSWDNAAVEDHGLFFAAQTIQNACGTQAILSVILNNDTTSNPTSSGGDGSHERIIIGPSLSEFKDFTTGFPSDLRGEALSNSQMIRETHNSFARSSPFADETQKDPSQLSDEVYHFIGYTTHHGNLYELDGLQPHPIKHIECTPEEFPDKVIPILQKRIERYPAGEIHFNLMAVCGDLRKKAELFGDIGMLEREKRKRKAWEWENSLRRHNFVGFTGEVLKGVVRQKIKEGKYDQWVKDAEATTKKKLEERRNRGLAEEQLQE